MCTTVDTVASQPSAKKNVVMVVGLEERTPDFEAKIAFMKNRYENAFLKLIFTVHPYGLPGEIAGTCSNVNWAIRQSTTQLRDEGLPLDPKMCLVTKMDTDVLFLPNHFLRLEQEFLKLDKEKRLECAFQSPLIYNLSLDQRYFFTRVTGILRTYFMMGFLIPLNLNTMSIYHVSLSLAREAGYWIPNYQMEDILQTLHFATGIHKQIPIHFLPLPIVSGPTSGSTLLEEFTEWRTQARRWAYGAAEVFHFFVIKALGGNFDLWSGICYGSAFVLYYAGVLCAMGLYEAAVIIASLFDSCQDDQQDLYWLAGLVGIKYFFVYGVAYFADYVHRRIAGIQEPALEGLMGWIRSFFHFLSTPFVFLLYNCVGAAAIIELSYRGRDICGHEAAKKSALIASGSASGMATSPTSHGFSSEDSSGDSECDSGTGMVESKA